MNGIQFLKYCLIVILGGLSSCEPSFNDDDKIFHAAPESMGIGGLSFGLYKDHTYLIRNSGGIASFEYSGSYDLNGDTIIFHKLSKQIPLENSRLIIYRYDQQDSTYWEWKYSKIYKELSSDKTLGTWSWQRFRSGDLALGDGDVYQIDTSGIPNSSAYHFIIRLDSLKNYR